METKVKHLIDQNFEEIVAIRRDLHMHPELSQQEERTMNRISEYLTAWGIPHQTMVGGYGVVAVITGTAPAAGIPRYQAVAIRGDMDALPLEERAPVEFRSVHPGIMHACGHDLHTAMLLGSARILNALKREFSGTVKFFFQPAEETVGGARQMIDGGCMEEPHVGAVIGFHVTEDRPTGVIELRRGKMNAATCELDIRVEGVACHGAHPDQGADAIVAASHMVTALQSIVSRNLAPTDAGVITIGRFCAGTKGNIVAQTAHLLGTVRALDSRVMSLLKNRIRTVFENVAAACDTTVQVTLTDSFPVLANSDFLFDTMDALAKRLLGEEMVGYMAEPSLGGDDFAFFTQAADGIYMHVGVNPQTRSHPQKAHNEYFQPDEEGMRNGILMEVMGALELLRINREAE